MYTRHIHSVDINFFYILDILLANDNSESDTDVSVSTNIFEKIVELLSDRCSQVQVASAITLFALNRANQKVRLGAVAAPGSGWWGGGSRKVEKCQKFFAIYVFD